MPKLDWLTRSEDERIAASVPYRLLQEVPEHSYGDERTENMLIQGDNLEALKALLPFYAGRIKCIYIDPPYNTAAALAHYDDNLEHSIWLEILYPRLELLCQFLSEDGSMWISMDDREGHYFKVLMDEVLGRNKFVATVAWQKRYSRENREAIGDAHEYLFVYARSKERFKQTRNRVSLTEDQARIYKLGVEPYPNRRWRGIPMTAQGYRPNQMYEILAPGGKVHKPPTGRCWSMIEPEYLKLKAAGRIYFGKNNNGQPNEVRFLDEVEGFVPWTWWPHGEVGHTDEAKKEIHALFGKADAFDTPKPERLIRRVIEIASNAGEVVLDCFLGSGTTAAVAHKMGRRYIGVEMGDHAMSHCAPRLKKVIDGQQGGISEAAGWKGGGGFRFYQLGNTIFDDQGRINPEIRFDHLAAHIWFAETRSPLRRLRKRSPFLGVHNDTAYYLLYNGILGDKRPEGGNVLTRKVLSELPPHTGKKVIYGECSRLSPETMRKFGIVFKQIPYDVKAR